MRSVIIHLREAYEEELTEWLNLHFEKNENRDWISPEQSNPALFISFYQDYQTEFDPNELKFLLAEVGTFPSVALAVDISGRINGTEEIRSFSLKVLNSFCGVVTDDFSEHFWSKKDIEENWIVNGKKFFDFS